MVRSRGFPLQYKTTVETIQSIANTSFPDWAVARKPVSRAFNSIRDLVTDIESTENLAVFYESVFTRGGVFQHHTIWRMEDSTGFVFTSEEQDFFQQYPGEYLFNKSVLDIDLTGFMVSDGIMDDGSEKMHLKLMGNNSIKYVYLDYNFNHIYTTTSTNSRETFSTYESTAKKNDIFFLSSDPNITIRKKNTIDDTIDDYTWFWGSNKNYSLIYDLDKNGVITQSDLDKYAAEHSVPIGSLSELLMATELTGWYITANFDDISVSYASNVFYDIYTGEDIYVANRPILKAKKLANGSVVWLDYDGMLSIGDMCLNYILSGSSVVLNFDVTNDSIFYIVSRDGLRYLYRMDYYTLQVTDVQEIDRKYDNLCLLPDDSLLLLSASSIDHFQPEYRMLLEQEAGEGEKPFYYALSDLNRNEVFIPNSKNTDGYTFIVDLPVRKQKYPNKSIKLDTYIDVMFYPYGFERWQHETLYNFLSRCRRIIGTGQSEYRLAISDLLGMGTLTDTEDIIYNTYIRKILPPVLNNVVISIGGNNYSLTYNADLGGYYHNNNLIFRMVGQVAMVYSNIDKILTAFNSGYFSVRLSANDGLDISFSRYIQFSRYVPMTDLNIEYVVDSSVKNSEVIYEKYRDRIYSSKYINGQVMNGLSYFDAIDLADIIPFGKDIPKYNSNSDLKLPPKTYGLFDGVSFGNQKIITKKVIDEKNIVVENSSAVEDFNVIRELNGDGSSQIIKFTCNSGNVVDDGVIKTYGTLVTKPNGSDYYRKIHLPYLSVDGFTQRTPDTGIDLSGNTYVNFKDIDYTETAPAFYDLTGRMPLYISKQKLASGNIYINIKRSSIYPGKVNLTKTSLKAYNDMDAMPNPKKLSISITPKLKTINLYSSDNTIFSDLYFNFYSIEYYTTYKDSTPLFSDRRTAVLPSKNILLIDKSSADIQDSIKEISISNQQIRASEIGLFDIHIDDLLVDPASINHNVNNISKYIKSNCVFHIREIVQQSVELRPPNKNEVWTMLSEAIDARYVLLDMFLMIYDYYMVEVPGFNEHYKQKLERCYLDGDRRYFYNNNLFDTKSFMYSKFMSVGAYKKGQRYLVYMVLLPKELVV